jgi:hypothetical protein
LYFKKMVEEKHPPQDMKPGQTRREDYTYEKKEAGDEHIACEPLAGKCYLKVSKWRTEKDWASFMQELCEQVEQWQTARKQSGTTVRWQFTTADARIKLARVYPLYKKGSEMAETDLKDA